MVCEQCQTTNNLNAKYCSSCGNDLSTSANINAGRNPKNNFLKAIKICASLVFICAIASSVYQTIFFNKIGVTVPIELYGEIFGRFFGYGLLAIPLIYLFLKIKKTL